MNSNQESNNPRLEHMSRNVFISELTYAISYLKPHLAQAGEEFPEELIGKIEKALDPFSKDVFKNAAEHLLQGIDPTILREEGGAELMLERLHSMPANLRDAMTYKDPIPEEGFSPTLQLEP